MPITDTYIFPKGDWYMWPQFYIISDFYRDSVTAAERDTPYIISHGIIRAITGSPVL